MSRRSQRLRAFVSFLNAEHVQATASARPFLEAPLHEWPQHTHIGYGALSCLVDAARQEHDRTPDKALALTTLVLERAPDVCVPEGFKHHRIQLLGRAWKEHANALASVGRWHDALEAAHEAVNILSVREEFTVERMAALSIVALAMSETGRTDEATSLLQACRTTFEMLGDRTRVLQMQIMEGSFLYNAHRYDDARHIFLKLETIAKDLGESRELARVLNNIAQCAVQSGDVEEAMSYLNRALNAFDREEMTAERQRVLWGFGRILRDRGESDEAMWYLENSRREFLTRGMVVPAAEVGLDQIEILAAGRYTDQIIVLARELVEVFSNAGMERNLRIALAYVTDQTNVVADDLTVLQKPLDHVRAFLRRLNEDSTAVFRRP